MKKQSSILIAALAVLAFSMNATQLSAQSKYGPDSTNCKRYLSYYKEYYKQKSYDDATRNWREAFKVCPPTANQTMLVDGTFLMRKLISKNGNNPIYKQQLVDSLMMIHDVRIENYPRYAVTARNNKGLDLCNYIKDDDMMLYNELNSIIEANGAATKANLYLFNLNAAIALCKVGRIGEEEVIEVYERNSDLLAQATPKNDTERESNDKVRDDLENLFVSSKLAECDKIIDLYGPRFDANPEDVEFATKVMRIMSSAEDCLDNDLFVKASTTVYNSNPNPATAKMLYQLYSQRGDVDTAIKYLEEAIASEESGAEDDAEYSYELAVYCYKSSRAVKAEGIARKAVSLTSNNELKAKAYMLLATIWGGVRCEGNEIAVRAPYWVAVDYLERAKAADSNIAADANKLIGQYRQYYPTAADAFMYDVKAGDVYNVNCGGFHAETTVKTQQ